MKFVICALLVFGSSTAMAYEEGFFRCKGAGTLPDSTYKIESVNLGAATLPYVEIQRFFKGVGGEPTAHNLKGLAAVSTTTVSGKQKETLMVAAVRLEFEDGKLLNCREP